MEPQNLRPTTRSAALIFLGALGVVYALPVVLGCSWLPTPGFPGLHQPYPRFPSGYDSFSFPYLHLPIRHLAQTAISHGHLPLWDPYNWLGLPIPAQYEVEVLSPLEWLNWLGGPLWWNALLLAKIWLAAMGVFILLGRTTGDRWVGLAAGTLYALGSYFIGFTSMEAFFDHAVLLPWLFLACHLAFDESIPAPLLIGGGGLLFGLCLNVGQPQIAAINLGGLAVYTAWRALSARRTRGFAILGAAAILGGLCGSLQMAFFWEGLKFGYTIHPPGAYGGGGTAPLNLVLPFMPQIFGQLMAPWLVQWYLKAFNPEAFPLILGVSGLFLTSAGVGGFLCRPDPGSPRRRDIAPYVLIILLPLGLIILGTLGHGGIWSLPVVNRINLPRYSGPLLTLGFSALGGFGFVRLLRGSTRFALLVSGLSLMALIGLHAVLWPYLHLAAGPGVNPVYRLQSIWLAEVAAWATLASCAAIACLSRAPGGRAALLIVAIAELSLNARYGFAMSTEMARLAVFGMALLGATLWAGQQRKLALTALAAAAFTLGILFWRAPYRLARCRDYSRQTHPALSFLQARLGRESAEGRVMVSQGVMVPDSLTAFGIAQLNGINPLQIGQVAQFIRKLAVGRDVNYTLPVAWRGMVDSPDSDWLAWQDYAAARPLFNQLNVRLLVDGVRGYLSHVDWPNVRRVYADSQYAIYEDLQCAPRAYFAGGNWVAVDSPSAALGGFLGGRNESIRRAYVEFAGVPPPRPSAGTAVSAATSHCVIDSCSPTRITLTATTPVSDLLILGDAYYPGWQVSVDGRRAPLLRAQGLVQSVWLEAGTHRVEFSYRPAPLVVWGLPTLVGWLASLSMIGAVVIRLRRPHKTTR